MPYDIGLGRLRLYPSVPHHLVNIESILWDTHSIGDTAHTVVRLATMVGIGIRENYLYTTGRYTSACSWTFHPIVVPTTDHLYGKLIHVMVIVGSRFAAIKRAIAFLMIGIAIFVPIFTKSLVATVFHRPHRVFLRLVDIQHLTAIFCFVDVKHLTRAYGTSAIRVIFIADGFHLQHVLTAYALVAALIEEDRGVVAVVDDGIAHQFCTLIPARTSDILFCIAGGHGLNQSHTVARLDILFPRGDMHPAHQIAIRLYHQVIAVITEPCRDRDTHTRPLVRGALCISMHHQHSVVEPDLTISELGLAETGTCDDIINL